MKMKIKVEEWRKEVEAVESRIRAVKAIRDGNWNDASRVYFKYSYVGHPGICNPEFNELRDLKQRATKLYVLRAFGRGRIHGSMFDTLESEESEFVADNFGDLESLIEREVVVEKELEPVGVMGTAS